MSFNIIIRSGDKRSQIKKRYQDVDKYLKTELRSPSERKGEVHDFREWATKRSSMGNSQNGMLMKEKSDIIEDYRKKGKLREEKVTKKTQYNPERLSKDELDKRRKLHAEDLKNGLLSQGQMMRGHSGDGNEDRQTEKYINWKETPYRGSDGRVLTNEKRMEEWGKCNKAFKKRGEEGRANCMDFVRAEKFQKRRVKYV